MNKSKDEPVDGAKVAAEILKRMPSSQQKKLVKAIQEEAPQIAQKIEQNLYNFDEIADLAPKSVQVLISQIEHRDLVVAMKTASQAVKNVLLSNMSSRKRELVQSDVQSLPQMRISDVEAAQKRILAKVEELRLQGAVHGSDKKDVWA